ncbi:MAG: hypothetical protein WA863_02575 [Methyloceanibacter sp.]|jgi:hypothetical protein
MSADLEAPLPPPRQTNASRRRREFLTPDEIEKVLQACGKTGRHGARDRTLILGLNHPVDRRG